MWKLVKWSFMGIPQVGDRFVCELLAQQIYTESQ